jgi:hypothetical protein
LIESVETYPAAAAALTATEAKTAIQKRKDKNHG